MMHFNFIILLIQLHASVKMKKNVFSFLMKIYKVRKSDRHCYLWNFVSFETPVENRNLSVYQIFPQNLTSIFRSG